MIGEVRVLCLPRAVSLAPHYICFLLCFPRYFDRKNGDGNTYAPTGGLSSNDFCNFDNFEESLKVFFSRGTFSTRSPERYDRLNMITAAFRVSYEEMCLDC